MQTDYYVLAHGQAANDRAQLRAEIEKLLARDAKLEQLVAILAEFIPAPVPAETPAEASHEAAASEPHAEAPADNHHAESHEHVPEHAGV